MMCWLYRSLAGAFVFGAATFTMAQSTSEAPQKTPIPFKHDPVTLEERGWQISATLLALLAAAGAVLYVVRKRVPGVVQRPDAADRIAVVDRLRLDPRTHVYVLQFHGRHYLVAQSGDRLIQLSDSPQGTPSSVVLESVHG